MGTRSVGPKGFRRRVASILHSLLHPRWVKHIKAITLSSELVLPGFLIAGPRIVNNTSNQVSC